MVNIGQKNTIRYSKELFANHFRNDSNVVFAVIFGSSKGGIIKHGSDLDIGVYFHNPPKGVEEFEYYSKLCDINNKIERIDFVNLNRANTILAFEAIKGDFICKNDVEKTAGVFSLVCREYEDVMSSIEYQYSLRKEKQI